MPNDLTASAVDRQNILNNPYAVVEIEKAVGLKGIPFENTSVLLKEQVAAFFEVDTRTIDNYLSEFDQELRHNGYAVIRGKRLKELKLAISQQFGNESGFVTKTTVLGTYNMTGLMT